MLAKSKPIAFLGTRDPAQARAFYEGTLGLRFIADEQFALVFEADGVMLRIAKMTDFTPQAMTVFGWVVEDIDLMVDSLIYAGVEFARFDEVEQDARGIASFPDGVRVAWFRDPDGNLLSLTEFHAAL